MKSIHITLLDFVQGGGDLSSSTILYKYHENDEEFNWPIRIGKYTEVYNAQEAYGYYVKISYTLPQLIKIAQLEID